MRRVQHIGVIDVNVRYGLGSVIVTRTGTTFPLRHDGSYSGNTTRHSHATHYVQ
jgi:hypothetical protein